jgi:hypothetical protein
MRLKGARENRLGEWGAVARVKVCALCALCALRVAEKRHEGENGSRLRGKQRFRWERMESRPQGLGRESENRKKQQISPLGCALCRKTFPGRVRGTADPSASPDFLVESCRFGQLHVVLFRENHISGAAESGEVGNPGTLGACDFFDLACSLWLESSEEHLPTSIAGVPSAMLGTGSSTACHKPSVMR